jgi:hypothetical protein
MTSARWMRFAVLGCTVGCMLMPIAVAPAQAATTGDWSRNVRPSGTPNNEGWGRGIWNMNQGKVRLVADTTTHMTVDECVDTIADWSTGGQGHYDARVVRTCRPLKPGDPPNGYIQTDPDGDGYWQEPNWFPGSYVKNMAKAGVALIDDDWVNKDVTFPLKAWAAFGGTLGFNYASRPRTCIDMYARVRTKYQDGHIQNACGGGVVTSSSD